MPDKRNIAGVVLAGGRSSRMGQDKALLDYNGQILLDHMVGILEKSGLQNIYVSGDFEGYRCIPDSAPHEGPARAMCNVLTALNNYDGVLFVPIDMPLLSPDLLHLLLEQDKGGYFTSFPLPALIAIQQNEGHPSSVKALLSLTKTHPVPLPPSLKNYMTNTNTPEEWQEALRT